LRRARHGGDELSEISSEVDIPLATGEDIYLPEGFEKLAESHAVVIFHPDPGSVGGILATNRRANWRKSTVSDAPSILPARQ
jgi:L-alanine-DL-glutamate epimerase-like enolase superfamily enzyme